MIQTLTMVVYMLGLPLIALAGLVSRLCWQAQRDRCRQDTLRAFASRVPDAELLEIHDVRDDGSHLHLRFGSGGQNPTRESHE